MKKLIETTTFRKKNSKRKVFSKKIKDVNNLLNQALFIQFFRTEKNYLNDSFTQYQKQSRF